MQLRSQSIRFFAYFYKAWDQSIELPDIERYINITFSQMHEDWNIGKVTYSNQSARRCEPEDFGSDKDSKHLYELWISDNYYFDIFCPDL